MHQSSVLEEFYSFPNGFSFITLSKTCSSCSYKANTRELSSLPVGFRLRYSRDDIIIVCVKFVFMQVLESFRRYPKVFVHVALEII